MHASIRKTMTPEQYLKQERKAPFKSEYLAGEIFAMAGASPRHVLITTNAAASFVSQLKGRQCFVFASDLRVKVSAGMLYTYPDIVIVCGMPRYEDRQKDTLLNPTALIEVLSASTEAYDRGEKFAMYRSLKSLTDYLLISQSEPMIEHFSLGPNGPWALMDYREMGAVVPLPSIECTLPLADVYDKVVFDDQADLPMLRRIKEPEIEYITITRPRRPGDPRPTPDI